MQSKYTLELHREDGTLWAQVVELPGVFAAGDSMEELLDNLLEAMTQVLRHDIELTLHQEPLVRPRRTASPARIERRELVVC